MTNRWPSAGGKDLGKGRKGRKGRKEKCSHLGDSPNRMLWCCPPPRTWSKIRHTSPTCHFAAGQKTYVKRGWVWGVGRKRGDLTRLKQLRKPCFWDEHSAWRWLLAWSHILEVPHGNTSCSCWALPSPKSTQKAAPHSWVSHHDSTVASLFWHQGQAVSWGGDQAEGGKGRLRQQNSYMPEILVK